MLYVLLTPPTPTLWKNKTQGSLFLGLRVCGTTAGRDTREAQGQGGSPRSACCRSGALRINKALTHSLVVTQQEGTCLALHTPLRFLEHSDRQFPSSTLFSQVHSPQPTPENVAGTTFGGRMSCQNLPWPKCSAKWPGRTGLGLLDMQTTVPRVT